MKKIIIILHDDLTKKDSNIVSNCRQEVDIVSKTLVKLGFKVLNFVVSHDVYSIVSQIVDIKPYLVFNLIKTFNGNYIYKHMFSSVLQDKGILVSGASGIALFNTNNLYLKKEIMHYSHIKTPDWQTLIEISNQGLKLKPPFIIKSINKEGEIPGFDNYCCRTKKQIFDKIKTVEQVTLSKYFVESYIKGRDVGISLLSSEGIPEILPNSEVMSSNLNQNMQQIELNTSKLEQESHCLSSLNSSLIPPKVSNDSILKINEIALKCWNNFMLSGYAMVFFRLDHSNVPWVTNITANPYIYPNSQFVLSALEAGYSYEGIIVRIIDDAVKYKNDTLRKTTYRV